MNNPQLLLTSYLKTLRLPTFLRVDRTVKRRRIHHPSEESDLVTQAVCLGASFTCRAKRT